MTAYMARAARRGEPIPQPRIPEPSDLAAWRTEEDLTQSEAAAVAGVELRGWQRWESGERSVPQWLADTLRQRWGSAP